MTQNSEAHYIAIDWGTSSFRAYLLDRHGHAIAQKSAQLGISHIDGAFASTLTAQIGEWQGPKKLPEKLPKKLPVIMCGMIGSAQGWHETPYLEGDATIASLAENCHRLETSAYPLWIIPGLKARSLDGHNDVMRGEETLLIGALTQLNIQDGLFCLPGTHAKWIEVEAGTVKTISTFMTGELFHLMSAHSILSPFMAASDAPLFTGEAFQHGLALASSRLGLLHQLFALRAGILTGKFKRSDIKTLLSAVLIATEIGTALKGFDRHAGEIILVCDEILRVPYSQIFNAFGLTPTHFDAEQAAIKGLFAIAQNLPQN